MSRSIPGNVNGLFTIRRYLRDMVENGINNAVKWRILSVLLIVIAMTTSVMASAQSAQNADIDWADAGIASLDAVPSGTTVTGSDGTQATVTWSVQTQGGGSFVPAFGADFVNYYAGQIGSGQSPLFMAFDNSSYDPGDKVTVTITLTRPVTNLNFSLGDIDFGSFADAVEVYYDGDLTGGFTNAATNSAFWTTGSSVTRTNDATVNGWRGTSESNTTSTNGNINFDFGSTSVQRIRIVYFSYTGTGDPSRQFSSISDFAYFALGADLSLTKSIIGSPPVQGGTATWRLVVANSGASQLSASGIAVRDTFPGGFSIVSASGDGSFNSGTSEWAVPDLAPGENATITVSGTISSAAGSVVTNTAEIISSSAFDPDSTVDNGNASEDDFASSTFTVQSGRSPGIPPVLSCPAGQSVFDWDTISFWTAGSTDNTYAFASFGDVRFQLTNDGAYVDNAGFGGQSPTVFNAFTGGLTPAEDSLTVLANQANQSGEVEITITLPRAFAGLQFTIFDVDFASGQFADRVEVVGSNSGATVLPTLTNGNVNAVSGNVAIGDGGSNSDEALGNLVVTFTQAVDTVVVRYGNHTTAPSNPGQQGIGLHDITVCNPFTTLSVTKVSTVLSDPVNDTNNPKAIPGALIEYLITVSNTGAVAADEESVLVWDDGPDDAKMCLISRAGGPVIFNDASGTSGLGYNFVSYDPLVDDDLEFSSNNGSTWDYQPQADADGCDPAITDFRVRPSGTFAGGGTFTLTVRYIIE